MNRRHPPRLATWLLDQLGYARHNVALAGDLLEEFRSGRSRAWYWRQTAMVIVNGVTRNAGIQQAYLQAVLVGFAAQFLVAIALWRWDLPRELHVAWWLKVLVWAAFQFAYAFLRRMANRSIVGTSSEDLRRMLFRDEVNSQKRALVLALVTFQTFVCWLSSYCLVQLVIARLSAASLVSVEMVWLILWDLRPALLPASATGQPPAEMASSDHPRKQSEYPPYHFALPVALSDDRTIVLRPENLVETAFAAADAELIAVLFRKGVSPELIRRAIWLGLARNYGRQPEELLTISDLASLIEQTARTEHVEQALFDKPHESRWRRLWRAIALRNDM
jgi:hypothetical protein